MKYIVIGLGNFGINLATTLARLGHEVIGVDCRMEIIEDIKDQVTHAVCLDSTKKASLTSLPLKSADHVIIGIGSDQGANIMTTALLRQIGLENLICRATSELHQTVLETMGITDIVFPEKEEAERLAMKLEFNRVVEAFSLSEDYKIVEVATPSWCVGKTIGELALPEKFDLLVLTLLQESQKKNLLGIEKAAKEICGIVKQDTTLQADDILVLFGKRSDIKRFINTD